MSPGSKVIKSTAMFEPASCSLSLFIFVARAGDTASITASVTTSGRRRLASSAVLAILIPRPEALASSRRTRAI